MDTEAGDGQTDDGGEGLGGTSEASLAGGVGGRGSSLLSLLLLLLFLHETHGAVVINLARSCSFCSTRRSDGVEFRDLIDFFSTPLNFLFYSEGLKKTGKMICLVQVVCQV